MVSRRKGKDTAILLLIAKARQGIVCPTKLERSDTLKVLAFEKELRACIAINGR
jgi:hypothetical protein